MIGAAGGLTALIGPLALALSREWPYRSFSTQIPLVLTVLPIPALMTSPTGEREPTGQRRLLDLMAAGQPCTTIARTVHIHPTVSEMVPTLLHEMKPLA